MSYDLYIWDGPAPRDQHEHQALRQRISDLVEQSPAPAPTPAIRAFSDQLDLRWGGVESLDQGNVGFPFSVCPAGADAAGPVVMISIQWEYAESVAPQVAELARSMGLVCIDDNGRVGDSTADTVDRAMAALGQPDWRQRKPWWSRVVGRG